MGYYPNQGFLFAFRIGPEERMMIKELEGR